MSFLINLFNNTIKKSREWRFRHLAFLGKILLKLGITPNQLTFFSFLCGLLAVYFLFQKHSFFVLFSFFHLLTDALDGVLARLDKPSPWGKYLDYTNDQLICFFLLGKIYFFLQDKFVLLVISLFIFSQIPYLLSRFRYPLLFFRTSLVLSLMLAPLFSLKLISQITYLIAGIFSLYSLLLQLRVFLSTKGFPKFKIFLF